MHINEDGTRTYSHTSLSLWRLCKRRWFQRYICHQREPTGVAAAFSVEMVHKPIEYGMLDEEAWLQRYVAFKALLGDPNYEDGLHTVGTGKRIHEAIRHQGHQLDNIVPEREA